MKDFEHPDIEQVNKTGYPNMIAQPEHWGIDVYGDEIVVGDAIIEVEHETILSSNLERYLVEQMNFTFKTAD